MTAADTGEMPQHGQVPPEDVPSGTFGHAGPRLPDHIRPCTPQDQARHLADLDDAVSGWTYDRATRDAHRRRARRDQDTG